MFTSVIEFDVRLKNTERNGSKYYVFTVYPVAITL